MSRRVSNIKFKATYVIDGRSYPVAALRWMNGKLSSVELDCGDHHLFVAADLCEIYTDDAFSQRNGNQNAGNADGVYGGYFDKRRNAKMLSDDVGLGDIGALNHEQARAEMRNRNQQGRDGRGGFRGGDQGRDQGRDHGRDSRGSRGQQGRDSRGGFRGDQRREQSRDQRQEQRQEQPAAAPVPAAAPQASPLPHVAVPPGVAGGAPVTPAPMDGSPASVKAKRPPKGVKSPAEAPADAGGTKKTRKKAAPDEGQ